MKRVRRRRALLRAVAAATAGASMLIGLATLGATTSGATQAKKSTSHYSGTLTWAEPPQAYADYIFPMTNLSYFNVNNQQDFQYLMYRPLYWFGKGTTPDLNLSLSLAKAPAYSNGNKTVTITLKNYKWSNGESVTPKDVIFWMNMLKTEVKAGEWAGYVPGAIPDDVTNVTASGSNKVVLTLSGTVNSYWFTYNELSQITPMPIAWDVTSLTAAPGSGGCSAAAYSSITVTAKGAPTSTTAKDCNAVYDFLSEQSGFNPTTNGKLTNAQATYATSKLWSVVDGPFKLSSYDETGNVVFVPNPTYSGPVKPTVAKFVEEYFTSNTSEYNALLGGKIDVGYIPAADLSAPAKNPTTPGANSPRLASSYTLAPQYSWGFDYADLNFNSTGDGGEAGAIMSQLYFRQALQSLVDQSLFLKKIYKNYGVPAYGPVPVLPPNPFASSFEKSDPYPYSVKAAKNDLKSHGWSIHPNGTDTCIKPGTGAHDCGAGITKGAKLSLVMQYSSGNSDFTREVTAEDEAWASVGINIKAESASFDVVAGAAVPCAKGPSCTWDIQNFGGWVYSPDYYPTGEDLFETGAGSNAGSYSNPTMDALIKETDFSTSSTAFKKFENLAARQLPVLYQVNPAYSITEIKKGIKGVTPQNPLLTINPETWRLKK